MCMNMCVILIKVCLCLLMADRVVSSETSCQDIDHNSCLSMLQQNPHMCQDAVLSRSVCPKVCNNCPLTCYSCQIPSHDVSMCNTITCSQHQSCTLQSHSGNGTFSLGCDTDNYCDRNTGHGLHPGTHSTVCCNSDLCNVPQLNTTRAPPVTTTSHINLTPFPECPRDIIISLDQSEPLVNNWTDVKQFLTDIVSTMNIGPNITQTRVALELFDAYHHEGAWSLRRENHNNADLLQQIKTFVPISPDHASHGNFDIAVADLHDNEHIYKKRFGNRPDVPDVVLFITGSSGNKILADLRNIYNDIITIGIGNIRKHDSVSYIATDSDHAIFLNTTTELMSPAIEHRVLSLVCSISDIDITIS